MSAAMIEAAFKGRLGGFELDAAFAIPARGITALTGPSGSGKTTLLRCMAGLTRMAGRLSVAGEVWQDERVFRPTHLRPVGMVFQEPSLLDHLSVRGNLDFGARRVRGEPTTGFDEVTALLGLEPLLPRAPQRLSGGERQRVALGRALLAQPRLLLMDEPLSSLDAEAKAEILPYVDGLHRSLDIPVIYVSHDPVEVARLADRRLAMRQGRLEPAPADPALEELAGLSAPERDRLALAALRAGLDPA